MFTHGNDSGGISMKFSAPNILGFRQSDWEAVKKHGTCLKRMVASSPASGDVK
jgi:hypothetical protein